MLVRLGCDSLLAIVLALALPRCPNRPQRNFMWPQPEVVKGQGEIADHGALYAGPGTVEKLDQGHELELYYGLPTGSPSSPSDCCSRRSARTWKPKLTRLAGSTKC